MVPESQAGAGEGDEADQDHARRSFHGQLLSRSTTKPPDPRKRGSLVTSAKRGGWIGPIGQWIGLAATFVGGLATGGGLMLLRRGEPLKAAPGVMIGVGLGCLLVAIVANLLAKEASKAWTATARG